MAILDLPPEQRGSKETAGITPDVKVYPMGFTPEIKRRLMTYAQEHLGNLQGLSEAGRSLLEACRELCPEGEIANFFGQVRAIDQAVQDGLIAQAGELDFITHALRTDEEIAVIFAKISRNPGSFESIGRTVTEEGAANFHQRWTVSVEGYGHASVAEHAVVHMAVENVPSLDGDVVTDNRLGAYTEFSARFKGRQETTFCTPDSVAGDPQMSRRWHEVHTDVFRVHDELMAKGNVYIDTDEAKERHPQRRVKLKTVADQFKNLMPASRVTSIGVTANAREVESMIRKMMSSPHPSVQRLGVQFKEAALQVSPTLVKYAERNEYAVLTDQGLVGLVEDQRYQGYIPEVTEEGKLVDLVDYDPRGEDKIIAAALYSDPRTGDARALLEYISTLNPEQKKEAVNTFLGNLGRWDVPTRALEFGGNYLVEYPGMTYGDWREYKRHRMQSYEAKDLDVRWGYMTPPLAVEMDDSQDSQFHGSVESIKQVMGQVEQLYTEVAKVDPYAAQYCVTRLHYRPAIASFSAREAYHLIKLRTGPTAHPFIRRLMWPLLDQLNEVQPTLMQHLQLRVETEGRPQRDFTWTY